MNGVTSPDGTRIAYRRSGVGPPLVLVHGTAANHMRWARVSAAFEEAFTIYAVDRRGRGGSGDSAAYSLEREGEDIAAVVDALGQPVNLLGHSYGAICALEAAMRTTNLRTLVLYEPPIPLGEVMIPPELRAHIRELIDGGNREMALITFFREVVGVPDEQIGMLRDHPAWPGRVAAVHTVAREIDIEDGYRLDFDSLRTVHTPTLLLLGGDSPAYFQEATQRVHDALPDSRIHVLAGQQHVAMDTAPEAFIGAVREFISAG